MATYVKKGDRLKGEQIQCEVRKISNPILVPKSGRHKTQQIILKNNDKKGIQTSQSKTGKIEIISIATIAPIIKSITITVTSTI